MSQPDDLKTRARKLQLHGLLGHWSDVATTEWLPLLLQWEADARQQRSLDRRVRSAISGASSPCVTSTGTGPSGVTAVPSRA